MTDIPHVGDWLSVAPWRDRSVSLIYISADRERMLQEHTLAGKRTIVAIDDPGTLLAAWHGQYRTDVRSVLGLQQERIARALD